MNIEMRGIDKAFGSNQVLKNAGFVLKDGEVHALMGENGAGKSTLMKILTGVYTRDAGTVLVVGFDATDDAIAAINEGRMAATIAQQPDLIGKTAVENAVKLIAGEAIEANIPVEVALVTAE